MTEQLRANIGSDTSRQGTVRLRSRGFPYYGTVRERRCSCATSLGGFSYRFDWHQTDGGSFTSTPSVSMVVTATTQEVAIITRVLTTVSTTLRSYPAIRNKPDDPSSLSVVTVDHSGVQPSPYQSVFVPVAGVLHA